jgi:hypothetical protein
MSESSVQAESGVPKGIVWFNYELLMSERRCFWGFRNMLIVMYRKVARPSYKLGKQVVHEHAR